MIEIISAGTLLINVAGIHMNASSASSALANTTPVTETENVEMIDRKDVTPLADIKVKNNDNLEKIVREYYKDTPLLAEISKCESSFNQYDSKGEILRGRVNPKDVGLMQINEGYHLEMSKKLGYDIYTVEGNLAYAKVMYDEFGGQPWKASAGCWSKVVASR